MVNDWLVIFSSIWSKLLPILLKSFPQVPTTAIGFAEKRKRDSYIFQHRHGCVCSFLGCCYRRVCKQNTQETDAIAGNHASLEFQNIMYPFVGADQNDGWEHLRVEPSLWSVELSWSWKVCRLIWTCMKLLKHWQTSIFKNFFDEILKIRVKEREAIWEDEVDIRCIPYFGNSHFSWSTHVYKYKVFQSDKLEFSAYSNAHAKPQSSKRITWDIRTLWWGRHQPRTASDNWPVSLPSDWNSQKAELFIPNRSRRKRHKLDKNVHFRR